MNTFTSDMRLIRFFIAGCWICVPLVSAAAWFASNSVQVGFGAAAAFALLATSALFAVGFVARALVAIGLVGQGIALTAVLTGHPWQLDSHIVFFSLLATLMVFGDKALIALAAAAIAVHHLSLSIIMPALIYPDGQLIANLARTLFHGTVILLEAIVLILAIHSQQRLDARLADERSRLAAASAEADAARTESERARAASEASRLQAETSADEARAAQAMAEAGAEKVRIADENARASEVRRAATDAESARQVGMAVGGLRDALRRLSDRNLGVIIADRFDGTYEDLRADFNTAVATLRAALEAVFEGANRIDGDIDEIAAAAGNLAQRTEAQAATLAEISATVASLSGSVRNSADSARDIEAQVSAARQQSDSSSCLVFEAVDAMGEIEKSSDQIRSIISVIDDIAFQTNLLALNAGVEAARAGDSGRGFAVVASEVRALAQRSSDAALQIKTLIEGSANRVRDGVGLVRRTGDALQGVTKSVSTIANRMGDIALASVAQSESLGEINQALTNLDRATQQNAAISEETSAATLNLRDATSELVLSISGFIGLKNSRTKLAQSSGRSAA